MDIRVKVVSLDVKNFKRIEQVKASLPDVGLFIIGGKNGAGKSSNLDALAWAVGGEKFRPTDPNRGMETAEIKVELSNGLLVERKGKNGSLKITGGKNVQATLDDFVSSFALRLPEFMASKPAEKTKMILDQFPGLGAKLAGLKQQEESLYQERLIIGRQKELKDKHAKDLPFHENVPEEPLSGTEMATKLQAALSVNAENEAKRRAVGELTRRAEAAVKVAEAKKARVSELERMLSVARGEQETADRAVQDLGRQVSDAEAATASLVDANVQTVKDQLEAIDAINGQVRQNMEKEHAKDEAEQLGKEYDAKTVAIEALRDQRIALLDGIPWPLPGMSILDGELIYNGMRWDCMATSERYRVAVAVCASMKKSCGFVLVDQLESMDIDTLQEFDAWLKSQDLQGIGTRVAVGPECSIIIEDGQVAGELE